MHSSMRVISSVVIASALFFARGAFAQVLITEAQPNPLGGSNAEWIEIHNTGTASVSLDGWTFNDYVGTTDPANESTTLWTFPMDAEIGPDEVIVIARQAAAFNGDFGEVATWELASGADDPNVPNVMGVGGSSFALSNNSAGDAVVLRDDLGNIVSYVEWGQLDRTVPGTPFPLAPGSGSSLVRIGDTGNSVNDFVISMTPNPFVGFMTSGPPLIVGTAVMPRHAVFNEPFGVWTTVMDADGLNLVDIYLTTATSSSGAAAQDYEPVGMTQTGTSGTYVFMADQVENLAAGLGFNEPATFHDRYVRFFILAEDMNFDLAVQPEGADESAANASYLPTYVQNVIPQAPSDISDVRAADGEGQPIWAGHSVRVQGVALAKPDVMLPGSTLFPVQDESGQAIMFYSSTSTVQFDVGDELVITGVLGAFLGSMQIEEPAVVEATGQTKEVPEIELTLSEIVQNGDEYEGQLVVLSDLDFVDARTDWPSDPNDLGSWNVEITDGTETIVARVTSTTDLFGQPAPEYGFDLRGVLNERDGVWQVFPRSQADVTAHPPPAMPDAGMTADSGNNNNPDAGNNNPPDAGTGGGGNPPDDDDGCGCTATRNAPGGSVLGLLFLGALLLRRRR